MKKNLPAFLVLILCALALVFSACDSGGGGGGGGGGGSSSPSSLKIPLPGGDRAASQFVREDTVYFKVSVSSSRYKASKNGDLGGYVEFSNIPVGDYTVTIEGKDSDGLTVSRGSKPATVKVGVTSAVTIDLTYLEYYNVTLTNPLVPDADPIHMKAIVGDEFRLPECPFPIDRGCEFVCWNLDGTPAGGAGEVYNITDDVIFSASIGPKNYTITYRGAEDATSTTPLPLSFTINDNITLPTTVAKTTTSAILLGWYDNPDFSGDPVTAWSANDKAEDVTVYAKWGVKTLTALQAELAAAENGATIYIASSINVNNSVNAPSGKTVTLKRAFNSGSMFIISNGSFGTRSDPSSKIIIDGTNITVDSFSMIQIIDTAEFCNVTFQNAKANTNGGAIFLSSGVSADFHNCVFTGCQANVGAAIYTTGGDPKLHNTIVYAGTNFQTPNTDIYAASSSEVRNVEICDYPGNPSSVISSVYLASTFSKLRYTTGAVINNFVLANNTGNGYQIVTLNAEGTGFIYPLAYNTSLGYGTYTLSSDGNFTRR